MSDSDLITIAGWEPSSAVVMLQRYGASGAEARAAAAQQKNTWLDRLG